METQAGWLTDWQHNSHHYHKSFCKENSRRAHTHSHSSISFNFDIYLTLRGVQNKKGVRKRGLQQAWREVGYIPRKILRSILREKLFILFSLSLSLQCFHVYLLTHSVVPTYFFAFLALFSLRQINRMISCEKKSFFAAFSDIVAVKRSLV